MLPNHLHFSLIDLEGLWEPQQVLTQSLSRCCQKPSTNHFQDELHIWFFNDILLSSIQIRKKEDLPCPKACILLNSKSQHPAVLHPFFQPHNSLLSNITTIFQGTNRKEFQRDLCCTRTESRTRCSTYMRNVKFLPEGKFIFSNG